MPQSWIPSDEKSRLEALYAIGILDTPPEERFDRVTRLVQKIFNVPIALITFVDAERGWFKSRQGMDLTELPREVSFCAYAILDEDVMVIEDALTDERFRNNPLVLDEPQIRFYAGVPVSSLNGSKLGTLCIIDLKPRGLNEEERRTLVDLASLVERELHVLELATVDSLTGLSNRRGFETIGRHALAQALRAGRPATLVYLDLDNLKRVNDQLGHSEGDRLIVEFSELLLQCLRESDVIARLGGDEFSVLMTGATEDDAARPLSELSRRVESRNQLHDSSPRMSYSVGVAAYDRERHQTIDDLIKEADARMYENKRDNRVKADS